MMQLIILTRGLFESESGYYSERVLDILDNDSDTDKDIIEITSVNGIDASVGSVRISDDKEDIIFDPAFRLSGQHTFTYTVTDVRGLSSTASVTINYPNTAPDVRNDRYSFSRGFFETESEYYRPRELNVLSNDSDNERDSFEIVSVESIPASIGTATISADNQRVIFDPRNGFTGEQTISYTVRDARGEESTATITLVYK